MPTSELVTCIMIQYRYCTRDVCMFMYHRFAALSVRRVCSEAEVYIVDVQMYRKLGEFVCQTCSVSPNALRLRM